MAELINLRRARKAKARANKEKQAEVNRVAHGTPKVLRKLEKARAELAGKRLENKRLDGDMEDTNKWDFPPLRSNISFLMFPDSVTFL